MSKRAIRSLILGILYFIPSVTLSQQVVQPLNQNWHFRQYNLGEWLPATVPGTVHSDLLANQKINDPFFRIHEKSLQWIDKVGWEYQTEFEATATLLSYRHQQLVFYGLDTYCEVFLNGIHLLTTDNMFRTWIADVSGHLSPGKNILNVRFYSPVQKGLEAMMKYGLALPASNDQSVNGGMGSNCVSVYTRKAPYHYGWDWGPRLVTSGIWRPVELQAWSDPILKDVFIRQPLVSASRADLEAEAEVLSGTTVQLEAEVLHGTKLLARTTIKLIPGSNRLKIPFSIHRPQLWWSNGLGEPHLYQFTIRLRKDRQIVSESEVTTGLRSLKLIRKPDAKGESFYFELNGMPVFAKGANAIPNDVFLPRTGREGYEKMVRDATDAHMNMIRIWGGGVYEDNYFYELCDRHGIMVWQDFIFACAMYPGDPAFLENVRQEAIDNVIRLRNHPSIALWCGNNEIDLAWRHDSQSDWGWKKGYTPEERERIFKAYTDIFHGILPSVVSQYTDGDDYWPSSPMAGAEINQHAVYATSSGDNHYWGVWHEKHKFDRFEENTGRFMSEYGFQSFPEFETVKQYTQPEDYSIESEVMASHQRSGIGNLRIREYMDWYYSVPEDFEQFLYTSQVLQADAMRTALLAHRRTMPYCMGSLVWQLNDCWPVASWSTTDYYHRWKAAHYAIREANKPVVLAPVIQNDTIRIFVVNDRLTAVKGSYEIALLDFNGHCLNKITGRTTVNANRSQCIATVCKATLLDGYPADKTVVELTLKSGKSIVAKHNLYLATPKELQPEAPAIRIQTLAENGRKQLVASTDKLARSVWFYLPGREAFFSDNYFDMLPGREYVIDVLTELTPDEIQQQVKTRYIEITH